MKHIIARAGAAAALLLLASSAIFAQNKTNAAISGQIKSLGAGKSISLTFDQGGNTSKLMAVAENFDDGEARRSGLLAMNFAAGLFYIGTELKQSPDPIRLSFWAMAKQPRFAADQNLRITIGGETFDLGAGRYASVPRENMEYLNYEISRAVLAAVARASDVRVSIGGREFTLTRAQIKLLGDLYLLTNVSAAAN